MLLEEVFVGIDPSHCGQLLNLLRGFDPCDTRLTPVPDPDDEVEARLAILERDIARLREQTLLTSSDAAAARADAAAGCRCRP
ncbi:MAG: hypothetical protein JO115_10000 [Pseudonocardiales bacterium]|nr:hypothetical protein [Pseudonocardiales bacterium]